MPDRPRGTCGSPRASTRFRRRSARTACGSTITRSARERTWPPIREVGRMHARLAEVERVRDDFETDRGLLERKVATLEIERNELGRAIRFNSETCHGALERVMVDGDAELKEWLASMRTEGTPRPPNAVVIARYLFETTD